MNWKTVVFVVALAIVALVCGLLAYDILRGGAEKSGVREALARHDAELRAIPGVTMLGTHVPVGEPAHIVVWVDKVTSQIRAAVPHQLEGYRVDVEVEPPPPPEPPLIVGRIRHVTPATPEQVAAGLVGIVTISGKLYAHGLIEDAARSLMLNVRLPASIKIWRPQGEGKEFITLGDIREGETGRATLTAVPGAKAGSATAVDLEVVYWQM